MTTRWYLDEMNGYDNLLVAVVNSWRACLPRAIKRVQRLIARRSVGHLTKDDLADICFPMRSAVVVTSIASRIGRSPDNVCRGLVMSLTDQLREDRERLLAYLQQPEQLRQLDQATRCLVEEAYRCGS